MAKFETNLKSYIEPVRYLEQVYLDEDRQSIWTGY